MKMSRPGTTEASESAEYYSVNESVAMAGVEESAGAESRALSE
jgi:hypothetical protein